MYRHLLIPTDGSALSGHAIAQGIALAKATGARVTGLFVAAAPTPLVFEGVVPVDYMQPNEHAALNARAAARFLGAIEKAALRAGVPCGAYMDASRLQGRFGVLGQIGCSFISGLLCRSKPAGPDGIR